MAALLLVFASAVAASAIGIPARATYGAQTTADEPQYLLSALSLAEDANLDISDELRAQRWRDFHQSALPEQTRSLPDGRRVSPHDPLLPLLLAPAMALGGWPAAKAVLALLAGVLAALLLWTAVVRLDISVRTSGLVVGVAVASVPLAPYGSQVYPELPAALVVTAGLAVLLGPLRRSGVLAVFAVCCLLPWLGIKYAPVAATLAVLALVLVARDGRRSAVVGLAVGWAAAGAVYLAIHQIIWTGWSVYASGDHFVDSGQLGVVGVAPDYWARATRLLGLLVERSFGIAAWQPAWLLLVPAAAALAHTRPSRWYVLGTVLAVGWANAAFVALTMAGWWFPGRQIVMVLPAAVLICAWWVDRHTLARRLWLGAGLIGVVAWIVLAVEAATGRLTLVVDFFSTANPLYQLWRLVLPDYLEITTVTWWLHGAWLAAMAGLAYVGWHTSANHHSATQPPSGRQSSDAQALPQDAVR